MCIIDVWSVLFHAMQIEVHVCEFLGTLVFPSDWCIIFVIYCCGVLSQVANSCRPRSVRHWKELIQIQLIQDTGFQWRNGIHQISVCLIFFVLRFNRFDQDKTSSVPWTRLRIEILFWSYSYIYIQRCYCYYRIVKKKERRNRIWWCHLDLLRNLERDSYCL